MFFRLLPFLLSAHSLTLSSTRQTQRSPIASRKDVDWRRSANTTDPANVVSAGWFPGWGSTPLDDVPWYQYTHMFYAFGTTTPNCSNITVGAEGLHAFVKEAKKNDVSPSLSIGGWTGSQYFSTAVATSENRTAFVAAVLDLITTYALEGIDFDWEYPGRQGLECNIVDPAHDSANLLEFLKELRPKLPQNVKLTAAAAPTPFNGMTNVSAFAEVLDHIEIMLYDTWDPSTGLTGPNSPLESCAGHTFPATVASALQAWTNASFPVNKILLCLATYGHSFNVSAANAKTGEFAQLNVRANITGTQPLGSSDSLTGDMGIDPCGTPYTVSGVSTFAGLIAAGYLGANGSATSVAGVDYVYDECSKTPFLYKEEAGVMVSYDDARSFAAKGKFVMDNGLAGFAVWEVTGDHNDILMDALYEAMGIVECDEA
ncbi:glycoside hydrolase family 18 protein [Mycena crocata]|nr:glycoside hydrolase family 18 protein [Mycena crocata]